MHHSTSVFVVLVLLGSAMGNPIEDFGSGVQKCFNEAGFVPDLSGAVIGLNVFKLIPSVTTSFFDKIKGFGACVVKEANVFKEDGSFDFDSVFSVIPDDIPGKEQAIEAITACAGKVGEDPWSTATEVFGCFKEQAMSLMQQDK